MAIISKIRKQRLNGRQGNIKLILFMRLWSWFSHASRAKLVTDPWNYCRQLGERFNKIVSIYR